MRSGGAKVGRCWMVKSLSSTFFCLSLTYWREPLCLALQRWETTVYRLTNSHAYTCIHHRIQLAVGDMTMSGWKPTISLIQPPPPSTGNNPPSPTFRMQVLSLSTSHYKATGDATLGIILRRNLSSLETDRADDHRRRKHHVPKLSSPAAWRPECLHLVIPSHWRLFLGLLKTAWIFNCIYSETCI